MFANLFTTRRRAARQTLHACKPRFEALEDRIVPTAGDLDLTFGNNGYFNPLAANEYFGDVAIQPDGKIIVVVGNGAGPDGLSGIVLKRFTSEGALDTTFGVNGTAFDVGPSGYAVSAQSIAIQPNDGKIVVGGTAHTNSTQPDFYLSRFTPEGNLDAIFFGDGGRVLTDFGNVDVVGHTSAEQVFDIAIDAFGDIIAVGITIGYGANITHELAIARYNADGSLDTQFFGNGSGRVTTHASLLEHSGPFYVAVKPNREFVVASSIGEPNDFGFASPDFGLRFYDQDGSIIRTVTTEFTEASSRWETSPTGIAIDADGKIVVGGSAAHRDSNGSPDGSGIAIARYTQSGTLDSSFGAFGKVLNVSMYGGQDAYIYGGEFAIDQHGNIVVSAGSQNPATLELYAHVRRYSGFNGSLDSSFGDGGIATLEPGVSPNLNGLRLQPDGKILTNVGKDMGLAIARLLGDSLNLVPDPCAPNDATKLALVVDGSDSEDVILIEPGLDPGAVKVTLNGVAHNIQPPANTTITRLIIYGKGDNDSITVQGLDLPAWLYGDDGNDTLTGAGGADVLIGGDGEDTLVGRAGRDLVIGGRGADFLQGGADDDILISGSTQFDVNNHDNQHALCDLMEEWTSAGSYDTRRANLSSGVGTAGARLDATTVQDDNSPDVISGGGLEPGETAGQDWDYFFVAIGPLHFDVPQQAGEVMLTLQRQSDNLILVDGQGVTIVSRPIAATTSVEIIGRDNGSDTLFIDFQMGGAFSLPGTIQFIGGGGAERDQVVGSNGADIFTITGNDAGYVETVAGSYPAFFFSGVERLNGAGGNDVFRFFSNGVSISGAIDGGAQAGDDTLDYSALSIPVAANLTTKSATGVGGGAAGRILNISNVTGGSGKDKLTGDANANTLVGNGGIDTIVGNKGNDILSGGAGNDVIDGGPGIDTLRESGDVNMTLIGNSGSATLTVKNGALKGTDSKMKGLERAWLIGGAGKNTLDASGFSGDIVLLEGGAGNDVLKGGKAFNFLLGGAGDDILTGNTMRDCLVGGTGRDTLRAGADNDILIAGTVGIYIEARPGDIDLAVAASVAAAWRSNKLLALLGLIQTGIADDPLVADKLHGEAGKDLFFAKPAKKVQDQVKTGAQKETIIEI